MSSGRADVDAAVATFRSTMGLKREIKSLPERLTADERVVYLCGATCDQDQGLLAVTDKRILFLSRTIGRTREEDLPYSRFTSVDWKAGLVGASMTIHASGRSLKFGLPKQFGAEIVDYVRNQSRAAGTQPPEPTTVNPLDQLRKLGELRDTGILTETEFEAKKAQILGRM